MIYTYVIALYDTIRPTVNLHSQAQITRIMRSTLAGSHTSLTASVRAQTASSSERVYASEAVQLDSPRCVEVLCGKVRCCRRGPSSLPSLGAITRFKTTTANLCSVTKRRRLDDESHMLLEKARSPPDMGQISCILGIGEHKGTNFNTCSWRSARCRVWMMEGCMRCICLRSVVAYQPIAQETHILPSHPSLSRSS